MKGVRMHVHIADHPLIGHKLSILRDKNTDSPTFRQLTDELTTLLAYEATRDVRVKPFELETPVTTTTGVQLSRPKPLIVPVLRAGLGMLEGMVRLLPSAEVGFVGLIRDEETLEVSTYANRLPASLTGRQAYVLDPMLATGHSLRIAIDHLFAKGADAVTALCLIAAPEGVDHLRAEFGPDQPLTLVLGALDSRLNERGYIVPGLGDAGDRLYGLA